MSSPTRSRRGVHDHHGIDSLKALQEKRTHDTFDTFYTTVRAGVERLSDQGGPFGFDISKALLFDSLVTTLGIQAIVETGCHLGDTAAYLARRFETLPLWTCDIEPFYAAVTRRRLDSFSNATVETMDSRKLIERANAQLPKPTLFYLDAHWGPDWPLPDELRALPSSAIVIDDFDIGDDRFSCDSYDGAKCGPALLAEYLPERLAELLVFNPEHSFPLPCLQPGRRSGWGVLVPDAQSRSALCDLGLKEWQDS